MKQYTPYCKGSFLVESGPSDYRHLYVVMNDACENNMHLLLPISSIKPNRHYDPACILSPNDNDKHAFITLNSYAYYKKVELKPSKTITKCVEARSYILKDDVNDNLFNRLLDGIWSSEEIDFWAKSYMSSIYL